MANLKHQASLLRKTIADSDTLENNFPSVAGKGEENFFTESPCMCNVAKHLDLLHSLCVKDLGAMED